MDKPKLVWVVADSNKCRPVIFSAPYSESDAVEDAIYFARVTYDKQVAFTKVHEYDEYTCTDPSCPITIVGVDPNERRSPK